MLDFSLWGFTEATSLFFSYVTLHGPFVLSDVHIQTLRWKFVDASNLVKIGLNLCSLTPALL